MDYSKADIFCWKYKTAIGISEILGMAFVIFVALAVMPILTENAYSQSTLYQCNTNIGINASSSNCFGNNNTPRSNNSIAMMNQSSQLISK
jgi:hypothetical protein